MEDGGVFVRYVALLTCRYHFACYLDSMHNTMKPFINRKQVNFLRGHTREKRGMIPILTYCLHRIVVHHKVLRVGKAVVVGKVG